MSHVVSGHGGFSIQNHGVGTSEFTLPFLSSIKVFVPFLHSVVKAFIQ